MYVHICRLWMGINHPGILDLEGTPLQISLLILPKKGSWTLGNLVQIRIRYVYTFISMHFTFVFCDVIVYLPFSVCLFSVSPGEWDHGSKCILFYKVTPWPFTKIGRMHCLILRRNPMRTHCELASRPVWLTSPTATQDARMCYG